FFPYTTLFRSSLLNRPIFLIIDFSNDTCSVFVWILLVGVFLKILTCIGMYFVCRSRNTCQTIITRFTNGENERIISLFFYHTFSIAIIGCVYLRGSVPEQHLSTNFFIDF